MELNLWNKTAFQPERLTINSAAKDESLDILNLNQNNKDVNKDINKNIIKERMISKGENEIKALLNSGFIVKNS
jgi:hypothetical protein